MSSKTRKTREREIVYTKHVSLTSQTVIGLALGLSLAIFGIAAIAGMVIIAQALFLDFPHPVYSKMLKVMMELLAIMAFTIATIYVISLQLKLSIEEKEPS